MLHVGSSIPYGKMDIASFQTSSHNTAGKGSVHSQDRMVGASCSMNAWLLSSVLKLSACSRSTDLVTRSASQALVRTC